MGQNKYDIFVSYSRTDMDVVNRLVGDIHEKTNARCWVDWNGIESGDQFVDVIINAIDKVDTVLFVLSDNSMASEFARREIDYARNTGKKIVPVVVDGGKLRGWFLFFFGSVDYIDIKVPMQYDKLLRNIGDWYGSESFIGEALLNNERKTTKKVDVHTASKTYKIGDLYDENGKQGIVFDVTADGKHGKIVSLDESKGLIWAKSRFCSRKTYATSHDDGMSNFNEIKKQSYWKIDYPAFAWCATKGEGWYLPAKEELLSISKKRGIINESLSKIKAVTLGRSLWSSTDYNKEFCAWYVNMLNGYTNSLGKYNDISVRAVSAF